ncbi:lantibiotic dehydratase [Massilia sp. CT11-108]|uniref:lantibiotic dehydratase n=1 Tax=Massilia sp. CT11-108 TaxID=3393900 RepID=UPI0039A59350
MNLPASSNTFVHQGFFHLRTPLLPGKLFEQWHAAPDKVDFLLKQLDLPELREAIYIGSPGLYERLTEFKKTREEKLIAPGQLQISGMRFDAPGVDPKGNDKLVIALARYIARAAYRCTPFGLFSTVSFGRIAPESNFDGIGSAPIERHVQYDAWIEQSVLAKVIADPEVREALGFFPNPTIVDLDQQYYYTERHASQSRARFVVSRLQKNEAMALAIASAAGGRKVADLAAIIARDCEVDVADAHAFISELIDNQVLLPMLGIPVIGGQRLLGLHAKLQELGHSHHTADLARVLTVIRQKASATPEACLLKDYQFAAETFATTYASGNTRDSLFQIDSRRDFEPALGKDLVDDISVSAQAFFEFGCFRFTGFDEHKKLFTERFGEREVPLELALHSEIGVPFPAQTKVISDLLAGVQLGNSSGEVQSWLDLVRTQILTGHLVQALRHGERSINITDTDIDRIKQGGSARPRAAAAGMFAQAALIGDGKGDMRFVLQQTGGRSGAEMFGRFTPIDQQLRDEVKAMLRRQEEADPERIYAEINHDSGGRVNNILTRATLREYEIVCLGNSALDLDHQIPTSDLLLRLEQGQYRLRSKRLNKEIVPRMTTVHNYSQGSHGMYHFLCALQWQGAHACPPFSWPQAFATVPYLPRVCYRNSVWAPARWRFDKTDAVALARAAARPEDLSAWRTARGLPRFVTLDVADNSLPIDLDNALLVAMLLEEVDKSPQWEVAESLSLNHFAGEMPQYSKEVVVPFMVETPEIPRQKVVLPPLPAADGYRRGIFPPGSAWSYVKVYGGALQADNMLIDTIAPLLNRAQQEGLIDRWFFIRYADPDQHLRVRFHSLVTASRQRVTDELMTALTPALQNYQCTRLALDTYEQERDRYGGPRAISLAEQLFHHDSVLATQLLALLRDSDGLPERWVLTLLGIESWLEAYSLSDEAALQVMTGPRDSFKYEFGIGATQKVQLGTKFRGYRRVIDSHFFADSVPEASQPVFALLRDTLPARRALVNELRALEEAGELQVPLSQMFSSFVHMFCNRMLDANARQHEAVLYDFMVRILMSRQSRKPVERN